MAKKVSIETQIPAGGTAKEGVLYSAPPPGSSNAASADSGSGSGSGSDYPGMYNFKESWIPFITINLVQTMS